MQIAIRKNEYTELGLKNNLSLWFSELTSAWLWFEVRGSPVTLVTLDAASLSAQNQIVSTMLPTACTF